MADAGLFWHRDLCAGTPALPPTQARDDVEGLLIALLAASVGHSNQKSVPPHPPRLEGVASIT